MPPLNWARLKKIRRGEYMVEEPVEKIEEHVNKKVVDNALENTSKKLMKKIETLRKQWSKNMENVKEDGGRKNDQSYLEKPPIHLLPLAALWEIARGMGYGKEKYDSYNWMKGIEHSRLIDATFRHLIQYWQGEDTDEDSGLPHLALAGCEILMLIEMTLLRPDLDDRCSGSGAMPWIDREKEDV
jgi:hypothetical protein